MRSSLRTFTKVEEFRPMADAPFLYKIVWEPLSRVIVEADCVDGPPIRATYAELRKRLLDEAVIECDWDGVHPRIRTKAAEYRRSKVNVDGWGLLLLLSLDLHLESKLKKNIHDATWFLYESSHTSDYLAECDSFFVVVGSEIIGSSFKVFAHAPERNPKFVDAGIWKELMPGTKSQEAPPFYSNDHAWGIGWARAAYRQFYECTDAGRVCNMAPGTRRFDALGYWVETASEPEIRNFEILTRLNAVEARLIRVDGLLKMALFVVSAVAAIRWFMGR